MAFVMEWFDHRDRRVEFRQEIETGKSYVLIENTEGTAFEDRTDEVSVLLGESFAGRWRDAARSIIDTEGGPEFTEAGTVKP